MNVEIDPVDDQNYEIWNCKRFVFAILLFLALAFSLSV